MNIKIPSLKIALTSAEINMILLLKGSVNARYLRRYREGDCEQEPIRWGFVLTIEKYYTIPIRPIQIKMTSARSRPQLKVRENHSVS